MWTFKKASVQKICQHNINNTNGMGRQWCWCRVLLWSSLALIGEHTRNLFSAYYPWLSSPLQFSIPTCLPPWSGLLYQTLSWKNEDMKATGALNSELILLHLSLQRDEDIPQWTTWGERELRWKTPQSHECVFILVCELGSRYTVRLHGSSPWIGLGMEGVGTAMGILMLLPPLFSRLPLPPLLPL